MTAPFRFFFVVADLISVSVIFIYCRTDDILCLAQIRVRWISFSYSHCIRRKGSYIFFHFSELQFISVGSVASDLCNIFSCINICTVLNNAAVLICHGKTSDQRVKIICKSQTISVSIVYPDKKTGKICIAYTAPVRSRYHAQIIAGVCKFKFPSCSVSHRCDFPKRICYTHHVSVRVGY